MQLQISLNDNNDNPPTFTSDSYKAIIDEGSAKFEPPLFVHVRTIINLICIKFTLFYY